MASSKDVELILKARLDQGDSLSNAQSIGKNIADTLESAFDGIGERIADKMMRELQSVLSQAQIGLSNNGAGLQLISNYTPSAPVPQSTSGTSIFRQDPQRGPGGVEYPGWDGPSGIGVDNGNAAQWSSDSSFNKRTRDDFFGQFRQHTLPVTEYYGTLGKTTDVALDKRARSMGIKSEDYSSWITRQRSEVINADSVIDQYKSYKQAKDLGARVSLDDFGLNKEQIANARSQMSSLAGDAAKESSNLAQELRELRIALNDNTKATEEEKRWIEALGGKADDMEAVKALREDRLRDAIDRKTQLDDDGQRLAAGIQTFDDIDKESGIEGLFSRNRRGIAMGGAAIGAASMIASEYANDSIYKRQAAAGRAQLDQFGNRLALNEDYGSMWALESMGGEDALRKDASSNVTVRNAAAIGNGLTTIGVGAAGMIATGATGVGGLVSGGIMASGFGQLMDARRRGMFFDRDVAGEMSTQLEAYKNQNQEAISATNMGVNQAQTGYLTARSLGNTGAYANYMTGTINKGVGPKGQPLFEDDGSIGQASQYGIGSSELMQIKSGMINSMDPMLNGQNLLGRSSTMGLMDTSLNLYSQGATGIFDLQSAMFNNRNPSYDQRMGDKGKQFDNYMIESQEMYKQLRADTRMTTAQGDQIAQAGASIMNLGTGMTGRGTDFIEDMVKKGYINANMNQRQTNSALTGEMVARGFQSDGSGYEDAINAQAYEDTLKGMGANTDGVGWQLGMGGKVTAEGLMYAASRDGGSYKQGKQYQDWKKDNEGKEDIEFFKTQGADKYDQTRRRLQGSRAEEDILNHAPVDGSDIDKARYLAQVRGGEELEKFNKMFGTGTKGEPPTHDQIEGTLKPGEDTKSPGQLIIQFANAKDATLLAEGFKLINDILPTFNDRIGKTKENLEKAAEARQQHGPQTGPYSSGTPDGVSGEKYWKAVNNAEFNYGNSPAARDAVRNKKGSPPKPGKK